ncbi:putative glutamine ABC transporter ATP-binding protein [Leptotrichia hofstadii F0254]|uniref:Putative glutamine ABC transporter ATP-binding protein n=1 Tax=Leptotrichia hofstadii F0254 TaxID=634994 RepID=C9MWG8_9FUSO|nr:putative glutamine ABC transporter ATP-binding protein [Leptotrichia hofstadii F0254]
MKNINLHVDRGEVVSLIGPSGSGKSTILRCIVDLESITSGEVLIEGNNLADKNVDKK